MRGARTGPFGRGRSAGTSSLGRVRWTRHPLTRAAALAASVYLVIAYADERSTWFWAGIVLTVLNLVGILARAGSSSPARPRDASPLVVDPDTTSARLSELLDDPSVASAWATAPPEWVQVAYLDDPAGPLGPVPARGLADFVWLAREGLDWQVSVGDEVKPYLDLDAPDEGDPILRILRTHPAVVEAWHEDREVYVLRPSHELPLDRVARLAARALATGQVEAAARLR